MNSRTNILMPLTNARGLGKVTFFTGLDFPIVMKPSLMGEPVLTAQAFYFLERLDSVVTASFPSNKVPLPHEIDYIIDNYLFEYSKRHPDKKITSKITEFVFWQEDPDNAYFSYDWKLTECLVLDTLNDTSIIDCNDPKRTMGEIFDWCLYKPYFEDALEEYKNKLEEAAKYVANVKTQNHSSLGTGEYQLPIIRVNSKPLTLAQVNMLEVVSADRKIDLTSDTYEVNRGMKSSTNYFLPQEVITVNNRHNPQLLAYYFSAVRDYSPISQFKNYYNVLEYFFEEAPNHLGITAKTEAEQIIAVLKLFIDPVELNKKFNEIDKATLALIEKPQITSSGENIAGIDFSVTDILAEYGRHIYQIRNACIHSKKTRKGKSTPRFIPSYDEEKILEYEMPILQWIAIQCIEKESII